MVLPGDLLTVRHKLTDNLAYTLWTPGSLSMAVAHPARGCTMMNYRFVTPDHLYRAVERGDFDRPVNIELPFSDNVMAKIAILGKDGKKPQWFVQHYVQALDDLFRRVIDSVETGHSMPTVLISGGTFLLPRKSENSNGTVPWIEDLTDVAAVNRFTMEYLTLLSERFGLAHPPQVFSCLGQPRGIVYESPDGGISFGKGYSDNSDLVEITSINDMKPLNYPDGMASKDRLLRSR